MKNIHSKIPKEVHKILVIHALDHGLNLEDILREIITNAAEEIQKKEKEKGDKNGGQ